mmetsp:Transcript_22482/g.34580  ORF Transcript_22482/g.34580 Transcript_22482/m.34580 type:complete len:134 (+) Transcript_22482:1369-1770(+)
MIVEVEVKLLVDLLLVDVDEDDPSSFQVVVDVAVVVALEASSYPDEVVAFLLPAYWEEEVASSSFPDGDEEEASSFQDEEDASFVVVDASYSVVALHLVEREGGTWDLEGVPLSLICRVCSFVDEVVVVVAWD